MSNKTILVTGASKGVGLACIEVLLEEFKCNVVALSRSAPEELLALQKKYEGRLEIAKGDVANEADQKVSVVPCLSTCVVLIPPGSNIGGRADGIGEVQSARWTSSKCVQPKSALRYIWTVI